MIAVYVSEPCKNCENPVIYPDERCKEIESVDNQELKEQKISSWNLLETAVKDCFGYDFNTLSFLKNANRKWTCDKLCFSLSHTAGRVAVAVSDKPVGVDIEGFAAFEKRCERSPGFLQSFAKKILCEGESFTGAYDLLKAWTAKESIIKFIGGGVFVPNKIRAADYPVSTLICGGYCVSVCGEGAVGQGVRLCEIRI